MRLEQKWDFLNSFLDMTVSIYWKFQVVLQNPRALVPFSILIILGLIIGFRQMFVHRKKIVWTKKKTKDLSIVLILLIFIIFIISLIIKSN
jgi:hypothetical protein